MSQPQPNQNSAIDANLAVLQTVDQTQKRLLDIKV